MAQGIHDVVEAVEATLWEYHKVVYGVYDYYSSLMEERKDTHGELSIWAISYNAYLEFTRDCELGPAPPAHATSVDSLEVIASRLASSSAMRSSAAAPL